MRGDKNGMLSEHRIIPSDVFSSTPMFMAPEVAHNDEQSFLSDGWSVGRMVIEMATGKAKRAQTGQEADSFLYPWLIRPW
ncbi:hypothetical protein NL676_007713 [Syzygium grande]|nr:hypothetical protein NL676_007713 [Syzygium grande]